jgi:hypothetical protein
MGPIDWNFGASHSRLLAEFGAHIEQR